MTERILILDFGSQYTQLIARAVREANVYCEIIPYHIPFEFEPGLKGIILSGSPFSVNDEKAPDANVQAFIKQVPVLGVCYGAQLTAKRFGGKVEKSSKREYGRALLHKEKNEVKLNDVMEKSKDWTPAHFITDTVAQLKEKIGDRKVVMALSGGVDSTVAATLIHRAIGDNLYGIFVDNGVLRKDEFENVLTTYSTLGLSVKGIDAKQRFYNGLEGKTDPEAKRKTIGRLFIEIFQEEAKKIEDIELLGQGTIYPDVIESVSVHGPSVTIKSHHNVGGLPEKMHLDLVEPLRFSFKDEVRKVGKELGIPEEMIGRHPFPGPGLAIRILGEVTEEKVRLLQEADHLYVKALKDQHLYATVWQAGAILLPVKSVGVMGDERTYEYTVALRAVTSVDGMTADWAHLPYDFLANISSEIINNVKGINRVVYDISSKPPATIEWE